MKADTAVLKFNPPPKAFLLNCTCIMSAKASHTAPLLVMNLDLLNH